jgi:hypothetical protein
MAVKCVIGREECQGQDRQDCRNIWMLALPEYIIVGKILMYVFIKNGFLNFKKSVNY